MKTTNRKWMRIEREDLGDAAVFTALAAIVILSLEFLFTSYLTHYFSPIVFAVEAAAAVVAGALMAILAIKATDDED